MEDAIEILTKMKIKSHFEKDIKKEKLITFCIKLLKLVKQYE